jgi:hypothetical protein
MIAAQTLKFIAPGPTIIAQTAAFLAPISRIGAAIPKEGAANGMFLYQFHYFLTKKPDYHGKQPI